MDRQGGNFTQGLLSSDRPLRKEGKWPSRGTSRYRGSHYSKGLHQVVSGGRVSCAGDSRRVSTPVESKRGI